MTRYQTISTLALALILALAWTGNSSLAATRGRVAITRDQVAAAIRIAGIEVTAQQVLLLNDVAAESSAPALEVESMERWGRDRMKVRLACVSSEECLPFYVAVRLGDGASVPAPVVDSNGASAQRSPAETASYVVRSGSPATLLLDGEHVHIRIPVICLEEGAIGQTIRVASKDRRLTYTAKVFSGDQLRGRL